MSGPQKQTGAATKQYTFMAGSRSIIYSVRRSTRAQHVRLVVWPETGLEVVIPARFRLRDLPPILTAKSAWICTKLDEAARKPEPPAEPLLDTGAAVSYLGQNYMLVVERGAGRVLKGEIDAETLKLRMPVDADVRLALEQWYRAQATTYIPTRVAQVATQIGAEAYKDITIRGQKTRWGSCSSQHNLSFNWRLMLAPPAVVDYVIIHELAHLRHPNHGPAFWQQVARDCPDYKTMRAWLKTNGAGLSLD